jgi:RES domain
MPLATVISDNYGECRRLGAAAQADGLAGLIAPSARRQPDGTTLPIFSPDAASNPIEEGNVLFTVHAGDDPATFEIVRYTA